MTNQSSILGLPDADSFGFQVIEASPAATVVVDALAPDMPIVYVNRAFERNSGYTRAEVMGHNCRFMHRDDRDQPELDVIRAALREQTACVAVLRNYRKDGTLFYNEIRITPLKNAAGVVTHFVGAQHDVTVRVQDAQALARNEALFRLMTEHSDDMITLCAPDGTPLYRNPAHENLMGDNRPARGEEWLHPDDIAKGAALHRMVLEGQHIAREELRYRRKDGQFIWVEVYAKPVLDAAGNVVQILSVARDITENKQLEIALREQQRFINGVLDAVPNMVYIYDLRADSNIYANRGVKTLLGYDLQEFKALDDNLIAKLVHPDDVASIYERSARLQSGEDVANAWSTIYRVRHKDGHWLWVQDQGVAYKKTDTGGVAEVLGAIVDITPLKQMESALLDSERFVKSVLRTVPGVIYIYDVEAQAVQYMNDAVQDLLGLNREQVLSAIDNQALIHPDDVEHVVASLAEMKSLKSETAKRQVVYRIRHADGTYHTVQDDSIAFRQGADGQLKAIIGTIVDVTHVWRLKEALRISEELYRSIIDAMSEGVVVHDAAGQITTSNPSAYRALGLTEDQLHGRSPIDPHWRTIHEDGSPFPGEAHPASYTLRTGQPQSNVIMGVHKPDDTVVWLSVSSRPLRATDDNPNTVSGVVVTFTDITEMKKAYRREMQTALEQERLRVLTEFIRDAAHEFRTPLSVISTNAYSIAMFEDQALRDQLAHGIETQVTQLSTLIDMMVKMTRINGGHVTMEFVRAETVVQQVCDIATTQLRRKVSYTVLNVDVPPLLANAVLLQDALLALLDNANRYASKNNPIPVTVQYDGTSILFNISDDGPGILPTHQPHIFEMFWRDDTAHSTPGLGLGLPMAQRIAEVHGGTLTFQTTMGTGTTFTLAIPVPSAAPAD